MSHSSAGTGGLAPPTVSQQTAGSPRLFRGLVLGLFLSVFNLIGALLAIEAIGGLGEWQDWQFIGLFGLVELSTGAAFVIGPNIWRMPVAEANTSARTDVRLAASTLLIPHWGAGAKMIGGALMVIYALWRAGATPASVGLIAYVALVMVAAIGISLAVARLGVARPDFDVVQLVVKRPSHRDIVLPGFSIGGMIVQLLLNVGSFPAVKLLSPSALYQPAMAPSFSALVWSLLVSVVLATLGLIVWWGRISWRAPAEQQREAELLA